MIVTTWDDRGNPLLQGSGFFVEAERVVTSLHVLNHASRIRIQTFGGETIPVVAIAATDPGSDLALLQVDAPHSATVILQVEYTARQGRIDRCA